MKKGQLLIWRSGFGCDLCEYIRKGNMYHTYLVKMITGTTSGDTLSLSKDELKPTTQEIYKRYRKRYWS